MTNSIFNIQVFNATKPPCRRVDIWSSSAATNTAAQVQILQTLSAGNEMCILEMLVPNQMVSALIGKQGAKIKEVTASTGGNMQFAKEVNHNFPETKPYPI